MRSLLSEPNTYNGNCGISLSTSHIGNNPNAEAEKTRCLRNKNKLLFTIIYLKVMLSNNKSKEYSDRTVGHYCKSTEKKENQLKTRYCNKILALRVRFRKTLIPSFVNRNQKSGRDVITRHHQYVINATLPGR